MVRMMKSGMRRVGQVSDAGEMKNAYKVLVGNLEDIRPL
jgi:hypothetical protein